MFTERTQVLLTPMQRSRLERIAGDRQMSVGAVIREAIDAHTRPVTRSRRAAAEALFAVNAPSPDWVEMKREIEEGAVA